MARRRYAGRVARRKSRAAYRTAVKWGRKRGVRGVAKLYATKVGQTTWRAVKKGRRSRRYGRRRKSRRY